MLAIVPDVMLILTNLDLPNTPLRSNIICLFVYVSVCVHACLCVLRCVVCVCASTCMRVCAKALGEVMRCLPLSQTDYSLEAKPLPEPVALVYFFSGCFTKEQKLFLARLW